MSSTGTILVLFMAGLGFFFTGMDGVKRNLKNLTSRRFRAALHRLTQNPVLGAFWGFLLGAISQSASAVSFIMVGMIASGLLPVSRALLLVTWANLGTVALVFLVAIDIDLLIYFMIGVTSLTLAFSRGDRYRIPLRVTYNIGLLFLGLQLMKEATNPLTELAWFEQGLVTLQGSTLLVFLLGALLRVVIQSSSGIVIIAVTLSSVGLLEPSYVRLIMHGTGLGVGLSVLLLSSGSKGIARQIAMHQAILNSVAGLMLFLSFHIEVWTGIPLLTAYLADLGVGNPQSALAVGFLVQQSVVVALGMMVMPFAPRVLARLAPPTLRQGLSAPHFVNNAPADDPVTTLVLIEREQLRIVGMLPRMLDAVREETRGATTLNAGDYLEAITGLDREIQGLLHEIVEQELDLPTSLHLLALQQRQTLIVTLAATVSDYAQTAQHDVVFPRGAQLVAHLSEALHTILDGAREGLDHFDELQMNILHAMTSDRGDLMRTVRGEFLAASATVEVREKVVLLHVTGLYERIVWMVGKLVEDVTHPLAVAAPAAITPEAPQVAGA